MSVKKLLSADHLDKNTEMTYCIIKSGAPYTMPHNHDFFEITVVTDGSVIHHINGHTQILDTNKCVFIQPDDIHCFEVNNSKKFEYINIAFSKNVIRGLASYIGINYCEDFFCSNSAQVFSLEADETIAFKNHMQNLSLFNDSYEAEKQRAYLRFILSDLFFKYYLVSSGKRVLNPPWLGELILKLNQPENFSAGVKCIEEVSGKTLAYVSRVFKEKLQTTPTCYINDIRLKYCAGKLLHSDEEIIDIAMDAGFNNLSHFYHLFSDKYGVSPRKYRTENSAFII